LLQAEETADRIHRDDRETIKKLIVDMMLKAPRNVQKQLSDAISIIGRHDFPSKWTDLLSQMVEKCGSGKQICDCVK
jgi:exportin-2 (importin alpha re-exporter)